MGHARFELESSLRLLSNQLLPDRSPGICMRKVSLFQSSDGNYFHNFAERTAEIVKKNNIGSSLQMFWSKSGWTYRNELETLMGTNFHLFKEKLVIILENTKTAINNEVIFSETNVEKCINYTHREKEYAKSCMSLCNTFFLSSPLCAL